MTKLTFSNGERTIVHYTSEYEISEDGVVCFYMNDIKNMTYFACIDEEYLIKVEEVSEDECKEEMNKLLEKLRG